MNRNIAGNGKINQDLAFAEKGGTYHAVSQIEGVGGGEERRKCM
jgi:hypothetical protein